MHFRHGIELFVLCGLLFFFNSAFADSERSGSPQELVFLTWPEYTDPEVISEFEQAHNTHIRFVYFQSDDSRDQLVLDADGKGYDVALVNRLKVDAYAKRGWLAPLSEEHVPNLKHVESKWRNFHANIQRYGSPYLWGTVGIVYRADLVPEPITRWIQLYRPQANLLGKIVMIDSSREVIGLALKALNYSINTRNLEEIKQAEALVKEQKPYVKAYSYINVTESSSLVTGETYAAFAFNGDALSIMEHEPNVKFILPEEGGIIWIDYLTVFNNSANKPLAFQLLNFLQRPDIAARLALYSNFASPNRSAQALLPQEFIDNPAIYPKPDALAKSEIDEELPLRIAKEYARIMVNLTE
jgi:spermidine/putrescine transport system substrate-binding protein